MKKWAFIFFSVCLPILFFIGLEFALRLFIPGRPPEIVRKLGEVDGRSFMIFDRTGPASFFGPQAYRISPAEITSFFMPKPADTVRIILTGESAMRGFPQPGAFTAASFLQEMLKDSFPDKKIEVLNFSSTAIASYPVMKITEAAVACDPDIIVTMVGHNEFFGAYGVVATRHFGSLARFFELDYRLRYTAIGRVIGRALRYRKSDQDDRQLMEMMAGMNSIPVDHPLRERALSNFNRHLNKIAIACTNAGVPLILCVPPSNETGLKPIGPDQDSGRRDGRSAREAFVAAVELQHSGNYPDAMALFQDARDRDSMPWRASTRIQQSVRDCARRNGVALCDLDRIFREHSGTNGIGWNLMDDHVHPNLEGQALLAASLRNEIGRIIQPGFDMAAPPPAFSDYLARLGDNIFDRFNVSATMAALFQIPFLAESNPETKLRLEADTRERFGHLPPELREAELRLRHQPMLTIGKRPFSGIAATEYLRLNRKEEALPLLATAIRSVPPYSSWSIEYNYFLFATRKDLYGTLSDDDWRNATEVLARAKIVLSLGSASSGQTERFTGRILQLFEKHGEAIPYLLQARKKLEGMDRVANDRALIEALQKTGQSKEADEIIKAGLAGDPAYSPYYR